MRASYARRAFRVRTIIALFVAFVLPATPGTGRTTAGVAIVCNIDAPAEIVLADVVPNARGAPDLVRVVIHNFAKEPVAAVGLEALVFDDGNNVRSQVKYPAAFADVTELQGTRAHPLAVGASGTINLPIFDADATSDWNVAVAVTEVRLASRVWRANATDLRRQALEAVASLHH